MKHTDIKIRVLNELPTENTALLQLLLGFREPEIWMEAGLQGRAIAKKLAEVLFERGEPAAAVKIYDELVSAERADGTTGAALSQLLLDHSAVARAAGRGEDCEESLLAAIAELDDGGEDELFREAVHDLIELYQEQGRLEEEEIWRKRALRPEAVH